MTFNWNKESLLSSTCLRQNYSSFRNVTLFGVKLPHPLQLNIQFRKLHIIVQRFMILQLRHTGLITQSLKEIHSGRKTGLKYIGPLNLNTEKHSPYTYLSSNLLIRIPISKYTKANPIKIETVSWCHSIISTNLELTIPFPPFVCCVIVNRPYAKSFFSLMKQMLLFYLRHYLTKEEAAGCSAYLPSYVHVTFELIIPIDIGIGCLYFAIMASACHIHLILIMVF